MRRTRPSAHSRGRRKPGPSGRPRRAARRPWGLFWVALALTALSGYGALRPKSDKILATVGSSSITERDAALRDQVIQLYYPKASAGSGLSQLIKAYIAAEILRGQGRPITEADLAEEEIRVNQHSLWPERLAKIKSVFSGDRGAFRRIALFVPLAQRLLDQYFRSHASLQKESLKAPSAFLASLKYSASTDPFAEISKRFSKSPARLHVLRDKGLRYGSEEEIAQEDSVLPPAKATSTDESDAIHRMLAQNYRTSDETSHKWLNEVVAALKPGEVFPRIVDDYDQWLIVRYVGAREEGHHDFEAVAFPKGDFQEWYDAEKKKVEVQVRQ